MNGSSLSKKLNIQLMRPSVRGRRSGTSASNVHHAISPTVTRYPTGTVLPPPRDREQRDDTS
jgi:hypothetical protein